MLSDEQRGWLQRAWAEIDDQRLTSLLVGMVDIPSHTGDEAELVAYAAIDTCTRARSEVVV